MEGESDDVDGGSVVMVSRWIVMMSLGSWFASRAFTESRGMVGRLRW